MGFMGKVFVFLFSISANANWGFTKINTDWAHAQGYLGAGQKIAILDTGYTNKDKKVFGWNFIDHSSEFNDNHGHGQHITEIIRSIAPESEIYALKVIDGAGNVYPKAVAAAIEYAIKHQIKIINCSWYDETSATYEAFVRAEKAGILMVVAADNEGKNIDFQTVYPASYNLTNMINVAASTEDDKLSLLSSWGRKTVHIGAPGENILSAGKKMSGASQAAAHVAGAAALIWQKYKNNSAEEIKNKILQTVKLQDDFYHKTISGGVLDIQKAILGISSSKQDLESYMWQRQGQSTESPHPIEADKTRLYKIKVSGAKFIKINFEAISLDTDNEYLLVGHENENHNPYYYEKITGNHSNYKTVYIPGDEVIIILNSQPLTNYTPGWGFRINFVEYLK